MSSSSEKAKKEGPSALRELVRAQDLLLRDMEVQTERENSGKDVLSTPWTFTQLIV